MKTRILVQIEPDQIGALVRSLTSIERRLARIEELLAEEAPPGDECQRCRTSDKPVSDTPAGRLCEDCRVVVTEEVPA